MGTVWKLISAMIQLFKQTIQAGKLLNAAFTTTASFKCTHANKYLNIILSYAHFSINYVQFKMGYTGMHSQSIVLDLHGGLLCPL